MDYCFDPKFKNTIYKMRKIIILGAFLTTFLKGFSQESTFNTDNGFLFSSQFMGIIDAPRFSTVVGYKVKKVILIAGYERIKYSGYNSNRHGLKMGFHIYPYKNQRKLKIFYQSYVSYKWHANNEARMSFVHFGGGIDYFINKNISVGYDINIGYGPVKTNSYMGEYRFKFDWNSAITIKYLLFR